MTQSHDFNPGILSNGLFWIVRIANDSVDAGHHEARMKVKNLDIEDYGNLDNALNDINEIEGEVSFDIRWHHKISQFNGECAWQTSGSSASA